jgi:hypothetical protein
MILIFNIYNRNLESAMDWKKDPEAQYRAGYEEGVGDLLRALEGKLPVDSDEAISMWIKDLDAWRLASRREVARSCKPAKTPPPVLGYPASN